MLCPRCGARSQGLAECPHCGIVFAKLQAPQRAAPPAPSKVEGRASPRLGASGNSRIDRSAQLVNLLALPGAFALALLVVRTGWAHFVMQATFAMEVHELGHATLLWLGSRWAVPLPMFTLNLSAHRSPIAFLLLFGSLGYVGLRARREGSRRLALLCAALGGLQVLVTLLPDRTFDALVQFAGVGGEFYLSALLVVAFYYRLPEDLRWDQARWFFLVIGACTFALNAERWLAARHNTLAIPWGSVFGGDGDMDHLRDQFGWTPPHLISVYLWVGGLSAAVIVGHYLYFAIRAPSVQEETALTPLPRGSEF